MYCIGTGEYVAYYTVAYLEIGSPEGDWTKWWSVLTSVSSAEYAWWGIDCGVSGEVPWTLLYTGLRWTYVDGYTCDDVDSYIGSVSGSSCCA